MNKVFNFFKTAKKTKLLDQEVCAKYDIDYLKKDIICKINRSKVNEGINTSWINNYNRILKDVYNTFTIEEETYFIDSFFKNLPDYLIAEKLNLSKDKFQNIKNSCLIKTWNGFHITNKLN